MIIKNNDNYFDYQLLGFALQIPTKGRAEPRPNCVMASGAEPRIRRGITALTHPPDASLLQEVCFWK